MYRPSWIFCISSIRPFFILGPRPNVYLKCSPLATVIAKNVAFICGSVLAVTIILTVWDEDVLNVEHLLTVMTVLGAAVAGARVFIPDENLVFCPEKTLTQVNSSE